MDTTIKPPPKPPTGADALLWLRPDLARYRTRAELDEAVEQLADRLLVMSKTEAVPE